RSSPPRSTSPTTTCPFRRDHTRQRNGSASAPLLKGLDIAAAGDAALGFDAGIVAVLSFIFATLAIDWMMRLLARTGFAIFVWYRIALGLLLLAALQAGMI
ncbi:MAG: undecaprenyl-diphosphate phosphatase, partial [Alphaproteobacteria bacterium]|nr:undecaprenyl-diphosphate phosphatase [Alphaproteobacteria bacterium]